MIFRFRLFYHDFRCWFARAFRHFNAWIMLKFHWLGMVSEQDIIGSMIDPHDPDMIYNKHSFELFRSARRKNDKFRLSRIAKKNRKKPMEKDFAGLCQKPKTQSNLNKDCGEITHVKD